MSVTCSISPISFHNQILGLKKKKKNLQILVTEKGVQIIVENSKSCVLEKMAGKATENENILPSEKRSYHR